MGGASRLEGWLAYAKFVKVSRVFSTYKLKCSSI